MQNEKNQIKSLDEEGSEVSAQMGLKTEGNIMKYCIEASTSNPETRQGYERGNLSNYDYANTPNGAINWTKAFWNQGYWVEIYDNETKELLAGPFNPDETLPPIFIG